MSTGMSHGWQGGSIAVYGGQSLYKIEAVNSPTRPKKLKRDGNQGGRNEYYQDDSKGRKGKGFGDLLADARDRSEESGNIQIRTTGYTKNGVSSEFFIQMRDYTFQR